MASVKKPAHKNPPEAHIGGGNSKPHLKLWITKISNSPRCRSKTKESNLKNHRLRAQGQGPNNPICISTFVWCWRVEGTSQGSFHEKWTSRDPISPTLTTFLQANRHSHRVRETVGTNHRKRVRCEILPSHLSRVDLSQRQWICDRNRFVRTSTDPHNIVWSIFLMMCLII